MNNESRATMFCVSSFPSLLLLFLTDAADDLPCGLRSVADHSFWWCITMMIMTMTEVLGDNEETETFRAGGLRSWTVISVASGSIPGRYSLVNNRFSVF